MSEIREESSERRDEFGAFSIDDARRLRWSPLNDSIWRRVLQTAGVSLLARALHFVVGADNAFWIWIVAILMFGGWAMAVELLLRDSACRRVWLVVLGASLVAMIAAGDDFGVPLGIAISVVFLMFRRYRPYRHLTSVRRAWTAGLALLCVVALRFFTADTGDSSAALEIGGAWLRYAGASLSLFWVFTLLNLVFNMRLHFLRLKMKLAVCAIFLAVVPFVLVVVIGVVSLAGVLGSGLAVQAEQVIDRWLREIVLSPEVQYHALAPTFSWSSAGDVSSGQAPGWIDDLETALRVAPAVVRAEADSIRAAYSAGRDTVSTESNINLGYHGDENEFADFWTPAGDTIALFLADGELWSLRIVDRPERGFLIRGCRLDTTVIDQLAREVRTEVGIFGQIQENAWLAQIGRFNLGRLPEETVHLRSARIRAAKSDSTTTSFWNRRLHIGAVTLANVQLVSGRLIGDQMLIYVQTSPLGLVDLFFANTGYADELLLAALAVLALLFMVGSVFALVFGLRITLGITSAVTRLDRGTRRLAAGDFDVRIDLPNEDELGDLALSFNEMAAKVKLGRAEAVARERLEREMRTAREIQERLLPDAGPAVPGFEVTGTSIPSLQVGGDYYDFLSAGEGRFGIAIGDISGKGVPAALLMSNLQASLAGQVIHPSSVAEVVGRVNDLIVRATEPHMFATFFYGVLDCRQFTFTSCNAGHNPPLLLRAGGTMETLGKGGLLIGMLADQPYEQETVELEKGDVLVLYTDGVTEAVGPDAEGRLADGEEDEDVDAMFGEEALCEVVKANSTRSAAGIKEAILAAVARHTVGVAQSDDITLVVIKRLGE